MGLRRCSARACAIAGVLIASPVAAANGGWVPFHDPREQAFTTEVPAGWIVRGGLFRLGYSDYRPMVDLTSSDGKASVRFGDVTIPTYFFPTQYHPTEGEVDDLGAQAQGIFARYRSGSEYARLYALTRFKGSCHTLTPAKDEWKPPLPATVKRSGTWSEGSVAYRCDSAAGPRTAYVDAVTAIVQPSFWQVVNLVSFVAPQPQVGFVHAVIVRAERTTAVNPKWISYQQTMDEQGLQYQIARQRQRLAALGEQVAQFDRQMSSMRAQVDAFESRQSAQAGQVAGFDNALVGITPTLDPLNGRTRDVWSGPNAGYWTDGTGTIVNSNGSPGVGYHQLQPR